MKSGIPLLFLVLTQQLILKSIFSLTADGIVTGFFTDFVLEVVNTVREEIQHLFDDRMRAQVIKKMEEALEYEMASAYQGNSD